MNAQANLLTMVRSGDVELALYTWGEAAAGRPTLVLVHGYPDAASVWNKAAPLLAQRFHVVAYDVRGAGRSSKPDRIADYGLPKLVDDLAAVADAVSPDRPVHLLCHDWGSIQGWEAVCTERMQGRIASYTSISGPSFDHAGYWLMRRLRSGSPEQLAQVARQALHSWYIGLFHLPAAAPAMWKLGMGKLLPKFLENIEGIRGETSETQASDGALGVNLYRANFLDRVLKPSERRTEVPVQLIFPRGDHFMIPEIWDDLHLWVPNLWRRDVDAGHWMQLSHPQVVADWGAEFIEFVESGKESTALKRARVRSERKGGSQRGKLAVVTGAGSGFGRETAVLFAEEGADIVAVDIDIDAAERTAELVRLLGGQAWSRRVDVGNADAMGELAQWVGAELGAPDIVVNNAGIGVAGSFFDTSDADWERVLRVNLWGVIHGSRLFGRQMIEAGKRGHIVNVASMGAFTPSRFMSAYNTSKAAVRMLSDCIRAELADKHIHVSTICPGFSITNITQNTRLVGLDAEAQAKKRGSTTRLYERRNLKPAVIARAILDAVERDRDEVPVGVEAHGSRLLSRLLPAISRRIARVDALP